MSEKVVTEATMKRIATALTNQKTMLAAIAKGFKIKDWATVQEIVQNGSAQRYFSIGDQFFISWKDSNYEYTSVPLDVVHFCNVRDADGNEHPGMILQWHYATPIAIQFDALENQPTTDETFQAGYYYYLKEDNGDYVKQEVEVGAPIPKDKIYVRNEFDNAVALIMGACSRWSHSAYRQWLNSDKSKGEWWKPQHDGDTPPSQLQDVDGFMKGLPADFLALIKPIQVFTYKNANVFDGKLETTIDKFFVPSVEEMYGVPEFANGIERGGEGEPWEYWKEATGFDSPNNSPSSGRVHYFLNSPQRATAVLLRTCFYGDPDNIRMINGVGHVDYNTSSNGNYVSAPACAIW